MLVSFYVGYLLFSAALSALIILFLSRASLVKSSLSEVFEIDGRDYLAFVFFFYLLLYVLFLLTIPITNPTKEDFSWHHKCIIFVAEFGSVLMFLVSLGSEFCRALSNGLLYLQFEFFGLAF